MGTAHGTPLWYELMTPDPDAAAAFYAAVLNWTVGAFAGAAAAGVEEYRICTAADGRGVAGMMKLPDPGPSPGWYCYVGVDDVDATARAAEAAGGAVWMPPTDIPGVGRIAALAEPAGAGISVMRETGAESGSAFDGMAVGHVGWNELHTPDPEGALAFYAGLFGWVKQGAMPMGELGDYSFLAHHGAVIGAAMPTREAPRWHFYFRVNAVDAAVARIAAGGGTVTHAPHEVPGGDFVAVASDPQGLRFGVVGPR